MNRQVVIIARKNETEKRILSSDVDGYMSVSDWKRHICQQWPAGLLYPNSASVSRCLLKLNEQGKVFSRLYERGWFKQYQFKVNHER